MVDLSEIERKVRILEDIEAIRRLKAKYWYSVDNKQGRWVLFPSTL